MPTLYVYRRATSDSARLLAAALGARRWRDKSKTPLEKKVKAGDTVIPWGEVFNVPGVTTINSGVPLRSKYTDAELLKQAGVSTVEVSKTKPVATKTVPAGKDPAVNAWEDLADLAEEFLNDDIDDPIVRSAPRLKAIDELLSAVSRVQTELGKPAPTSQVAQAIGEWIGRDSAHTGGSDLLKGTGTDYFVKKEEFVKEYRVHSFLGRSIRAGVKVHRTDADWIQKGKTPHDWIRSWDGGWRISYDGQTVKQKHRDLAHLAVKTLGLDFGAVDIGERADGTLVVLEVNRAPGLDGGTVPAYTKALKNFLAGTWTATNKPPKGN